ncbi:hypothetical protein BCU84_15170 [Shewanella sp. 10N.286.51.B7]|nr:hypothetical protein BCU84_15170 [Shewanella sp. 10N.286.51.B7]
MSVNFIIPFFVYNVAYFTLTFENKDFFNIGMGCALSNLSLIVINGLIIKFENSVYNLMTVFYLQQGKS